VEAIMTFHGWRTTLVLATLFVLAAASCGGGEERGSGAGGEGDRAAGASIDVTLSEFAIEPSHLDGPAGTPLTFAIRNDGAAAHTFGVRAGGQTIETASIGPGSSDVLEVPALESGTYEVLCTVPGHGSLGMTGSLAIGGGTGAAPSGTGSEDHSTTMTAEEMAAAHEAGVQAFLAGDETATVGGQPLEPRIEDGVKVFELDVTHAHWEVSKGVVKTALAYNGQIPGPELRVHPGDAVRIILRNHIDQPTILHLHGITLQNAMDGVPYVTQTPVMPGASWTYEFEVVDPPGMYVYHSHFNSVEQVGSGLYGALIVEPKSGDWREVYGVEPAAEYSLFTGDGPLGFVLNGKSFPATAPLAAEQGDWVLIHLANDGELLHPMHLHGYHFQVVGQDGYPLSPQNRYMVDTLVVAPGSRYDILVKADQPGAWAFHCHILTHVEGPEGMFGMVTALVVG
jgi:FtsP/CotA-like multicopper oxidase with cupredoxin domain